MTDKKYLSGLDLFRFIAAICVTANHIFMERFNFMNLYGSEMLSRWGVGFFFLITGYFLKDKFKDITKYCFRIFVLYVFWTIFYALYMHYDIWNVKDFLSALRSGIVMPLWYFPTLLMCVVWVWVLKKIVKKPTTLCIITGLLFIIALMGDTYSNVEPIRTIMDKYFFSWHERLLGTHSTRDGIFNGSFYISLGIWLKSRASKGKSVVTKWGTFIPLLAVVIILYVAEVYCLIRFEIGGRDVLLTTTVLCPMIFCLANSFKVDKQISVLMRNISSLIYTLHYLFVEIFNPIIWNQGLKYFLVVSCSIVLGWIIIKASKWIKPLNYIY